MTAFAAWVQGPGGTILLPALTLACGIVIGWGWRGVREARRIRERAAAREGVRAARQFRAMRAELHHEDQAMALANARPISQQLAERRQRKTSTAAFLNPDLSGALTTQAVDVPHEWRHQGPGEPEPWEAELDQAIADLHAGMDAWRAEHGISQ